MDNTEPVTPSVASPPDPAQDQPATTLPGNIAIVLHAIATAPP